MHIYKKPNIKAPRFRPQVHTLLNKEFITLFKEKHPQYKDIPDDDLKKIVEVYNRALWETVIKERDGVELPCQLGYIFLGSCQSYSKKNYNYGSSLKHGQLLKNHNFATDGLVAKIFFTNYALKYKYSMRELWAFKGHRDFTRTVRKQYPENFSQYVLIDSTKQISALFEKRIRKDHAIRKTKEEISDYDEFDLN